MRKRIFSALLVLMASISMVMAQSMKVYQDGQLKAIYYISKSDSVVFSEDFPFPPGEDPVDSNPPKVAYTHAVDLGLPSGLKWADMNVGAEKAEDYGWYLAWGETEEKSTYDWDTYQWCNDGSESKMTKYSTSTSYWDSSLGTSPDQKIALDPEDDAAHVNWGGNWRMPTRAEQDELRAQCTWTWTTQNGVKGYNVKGPNGNSIFLPASGYRDDSSLYYVGSDGYYWSSSLGTSDSNYAYYLGFLSGFVGWSYYYRYYGRSVRAVCQ